MPNLQVGQRVVFSAVGHAAMVHGPYRARTGTVEQVREEAISVRVDWHKQSTWYPAAYWEPLPPEKDPNAQP